MNSENSSPPWLSVVTVVRNDPKGFESTIQSLARQDLTSVQFVVVDGSDDLDEIQQVLSRFPELTSNYCWQKPEGIYAAMNTGLKVATGEYVLFANAGDTFYSDSVLANIHESLRGERPDWLVGRVCIIGSDGNSVITQPINFEIERARLFARGIFPPHQATIVRTETLRSLEGFSSRYAIAADYHTALRLAELSPPVVTDVVIMSFYEGGLSTAKWQQSFEEFHAARLEVYTPRGIKGVMELIDTYWHFSTVWLYRNVVARVQRKRKTR